MSAPIIPTTSEITVPFRVTHDLQNVRMSADEDVGTVCVDQLSCPRIISARITAHMGHQDLHPLTLEDPVEGVFETQVVVVAVACHPHEGLEPRDLRGKVHPAPEIAGMPYLVHRLQESLDAVVKDAMGI